LYIQCPEKSASKGCIDITKSHDISSCSECAKCGNIACYGEITTGTDSIRILCRAKHFHAGIRFQVALNIDVEAWVTEEGFIAWCRCGDDECARIEGAIDCRGGCCMQGCRCNHICTCNPSCIDIARSDIVCTEGQDICHCLILWESERVGEIPGVGIAACHSEI